MSNILKCPSCGGINPPEAKFCTFCGVEFSEEFLNHTINVQSSTSEDNAPSTKVNYHSSTNKPAKPYQEKVIAALLAFFLGYIGIHQFYLGNNERGILYLCFSWTGIPAIIAIIDGIIYLTESDEEFYAKHLVKKNESI